MRDKELDSILSPLRNPAINELQLQKWQKSVRQELKRREQSNWRRLGWLQQVAAGIAIGFLIGSFVASSEPQEKVKSPATIEHIYSNTY